MSLSGSSAGSSLFVVRVLGRKSSTLSQTMGSAVDPSRIWSSVSVSSNAELFEMVGVGGGWPS